MSARPVTLITGASAGLGAEFARQCAGRGEALALTARRGDRLEALKAELGGKVHVFPLDLAEPGAPARLAGAVEAAGLQVATLINNAGFGAWAPFAELTAERQREMVDLNCGALTELTRLVVPGMIARGRGGILNVASVAAFMAGPGSAVYYATKAYVLSFSEALHHELKGKGVKVSALCPGPVRTEFADVAGITIKAFERMAMAPGPVVRAGLKGLDRNQAVVVPGGFAKVAAYGGRLTPRAFSRRMVARVKS